MKKYQNPIVETIVVSKESILTTSANQPDVLFDARLLDVEARIGG